MLGLGLGRRLLSVNGSGVTPSLGVLDFLSVSPLAAYSMRRMRAPYTGSLLRVRRSSDNAEQDIHATITGDLNTTELLGFCGANDGFVTTWHDQTGHGHHFVQPTAATQPRIVASGALESENSIPALRFDYIAGSFREMDSVDSGWLPIGGANRTLNLLYRPLDAITDMGFVGWGSGGLPLGQFVMYRFATYEPLMSQFAGDVAGTTGYDELRKIITITYNNPTVKLIKNGVDVTSGDNLRTLATLDSPLILGRAAITGNSILAHVQELTVFPSSLSDADRNILERSQGAYFGISVS